MTFYNLFRQHGANDINIFFALRLIILIFLKNLTIFKENLIVFVKFHFLKMSSREIDKEKVLPKFRRLVTVYLGSVSIITLFTPV